jgi:hypothetical protein
VGIGRDELAPFAQIRHCVLVWFLFLDFFGIARSVFARAVRTRMRALAAGKVLPSPTEGQSPPRSPSRSSELCLRVSSSSSLAVLAIGDEAFSVDGEWPGSQLRVPPGGPMSRLKAALVHMPRFTYVSLVWGVD